METQQTGYTRSREPEIFFFTMSGNWPWSKRTADYWRHWFGVPIRHGGNPMEDYFPPDMEPAFTQTPAPSLAVLATEMQTLLSSSTTFGDSMQLLTEEQRAIFHGSLRILSTSHRLSGIFPDWLVCTIVIRYSLLPKRKPCSGRVCVCGTSE